MPNMVPMHSPLQKGSLGALCVLLCTSLACHADSAALGSGLNCQGVCQAARLIERCWQPASAYPDRLVPAEFRSSGTQQGPAAEPRPLMDWRPPDTHWVAKLKGIKEVRLLTLVDIRGTRLFVGVNEEGLAGLALRSRRLEDISNKSSRPKKTTRKLPPEAHASAAWQLRHTSLIYY